MRAVSFVIIHLLLAGIYMSCSGQNEDTKQDKVSGDKIEVYYFHFTRRCATCNAVEEEAKKAISENYPKKFEDNEITFISVNLDEDEGKEIGEKVGATGQALLIIKGDKKINLTNEGFMNARSNSSKFHKVIKKEIDKLI